MPDHTLTQRDENPYLIRHRNRGDGLRVDDDFFRPQEGFDLPIRARHHAQANDRIFQQNEQPQEMHLHVHTHLHNHARLSPRPLWTPPLRQPLPPVILQPVIPVVQLPDAGIMPNARMPQGRRHRQVPFEDGPYVMPFTTTYDTAAANTDRHQFQDTSVPFYGRDPAQWRNYLERDVPEASHIATAGRGREDVPRRRPGYWAEDYEPDHRAPRWQRSDRQFEESHSDDEDEELFRETRHHREPRHNGRHAQGRHRQSRRHEYPFATFNDRETYPPTPPYRPVDTSLDSSITDATRRAALEELRNHLSRRHRHRGDPFAPDLTERRRRDWGERGFGGTRP